MRSSLFFSSILHSIIFVSNVSTYSEYDTVYDTITDSTKRAEHALSSLQIWYNPSTGLWETTGWWNSANIITMIGDFAKVNRENQRLQNLAARIFANSLLQAPSMNPQPNIENQTLPTQSMGIAHETPISLNLTSFKTGYTKIFRSGSKEPVTAYPENWHNLVSSHDNFPTLPSFSGSSESSNIKLPTPKPSDWLDGFYDDDLWWALAWINAYDVTRKSSYLDLAEGIFLAVTRVWPSHCFNGGIYWSHEKTYVNAIANELFFSTAAHLANRVGHKNKTTYVDWAQRSLAWFLRSGMMNERGTINDGLTDGCENNGRTTWSYNQGVVLGGLVELHRAKPDTAHLQLAHDIASAAIGELSDGNGVLHDACEPGCGADGTQFKGVFMRNLRALHAAAPRAMYARFIRANAESIWRYDRRRTVFSVNWAGPFVEPANASTQSSAMDALVAAVIVG